MRGELKLNLAPLARFLRGEDLSLLSNSSSTPPSPSMIHIFGVPDPEIGVDEPDAVALDPDLDLAELPDRDLAELPDRDLAVLPDRDLAVLPDRDLAVLPDLDLGVLPDLDLGVLANLLGVRDGELDTSPSSLPLSSCSTSLGCIVVSWLRRNGGAKMEVGEGSWEADPFRSGIEMLTDSRIE